MNGFLTFIRTRERRSNAMTSARIQPFCEKNINLGCFDGTRINPRNITQRNVSLFIYKTLSVYFGNRPVLVFNRRVEQ